MKAVIAAKEKQLVEKHGEVAIRGLSKQIRMIIKIEELTDREKAIMILQAVL